MNIVKSIGDRFRRNTTYVGGVASDSYMPYPTVDAKIIASYQTNPTVYTCADLISKSIANVNFNCKSRYWQKAFDRPNEYQSTFDFWRSVAWDALIFGNGYVLKSEENKASQGTMAPLDPVNMMMSGRTVPRYETVDTGINYSPQRVLHLRHGGGSGVTAIGAVEAGISRIRALASCDKEIDSVFRNGISAQYVLSGGKGDEGSITKMMEGIRDNFWIGGKQRGGVVALGMDFELNKLQGSTPADSDLRELREDLIREIAALFGVPPFAVGGASDTKFTNTVARHQQTNTYALMPLATNIAQKFSHSLGEEVTFDEESIIESDFAMKLEFAIQASGGAVLTPNESRERWLHADPVEGGDMLRAGWTEESGSDDEGRNPIDESDGSEADE